MGPVKVKASTLAATPGASLHVASCMKRPSRGRQEDLVGRDEYSSLRMCLSNSINSIASTAMMVTPCSSMVVRTSMGTLAGAGAGLGAGIQPPGAEAITERL